MNKKKFLLLILTILFTITNVNAATKNIEITDVSVADKSGTITVVDPVFTSNEITSNITFNQKDDFVTFELTLKNNEDDKYKIESIKDNNTNNNLKIEYDYDSNYISKGDTSKIKVKLTYKNQLVNVDKVSLNDLKIIINLVNEEGESSQIVVNPTTSDNILHYLVLLIVALTGLVFTQKKKKHVGRALLILPIILLPFAIFAKESYKINIKFTDIDVIGKFENYNITINPDNGEGIDTRTITYGQKVGTLPSNPEKDGYTFEKWVDNNGREVTSETVITGPITIKAKYNIIEYNITYNYDGGSATNPSKYTIEDEITLNNPTRNGYAFAGWTGTGISTPVSTVTIPVGSKEARSYTAHWTQGQDTPYRVIHKYQNLDLTTYTDVVRNLNGPTGDTITVAFESKYGFDNPASTQDVTIDPDNLQVVTYYYTRTNFNFSISDRTYVDASSTADNSYPYETNIYVKAVERPGYSFAWSDGDTNYERTFKLEENKTIYPVYTANSNTPYKVKHYKMDLDGIHYTIAATQNLTGTTGAEITPLTNTYDGFTSPSTQTTTISGNGDTEVEYYYTRNQQHVTITNPEYVTEGDISDNYYYEEQITLTAKTRDGYTFSKWSNEDTNNPTTITIGTNDITIGPEYTANTNTPYKVKHYKMDTDGTNYTIAATQNLTGTTGAEITPATNTYDGFTAPSTQTTFISGNGDTEVEYYYTRNQYTLTITNPEFVEVDKSGSYYYEEQVSLTAIERPGYTFAGWSTGESTKTITITIPVDGITVEPLYTANNNTTYKVIHKYAKLTDGYDIEEVVGTGTTGDTIPAPIKSKTGFVNPTSQNITIAADGNASVTYEYQREEYAFTITDRTYLDSTSTSNGTYPYETPITLKAKTREGYTFKWSDDVTDLERTFDLTKATTLSLVYTANTYNVHFDKNDELAEGSMSDQEFTYDTPENLDANLFVKTGYTFAGWNTSPDGTGLPYIDGAEVTNLATTGTVNLYAEWTPNTNTTYKVIHKKQNVTLDGYEEIVENLTGTSDSTVTPTVNNYTGFTKPTAQTVTISRLGDTVVTYVYDREMYTITFNTDGGSTVTDQEVAYGAKATRPSPDPTKTGYTFDNWYSDSNHQTLFDFDEPITASVPVYGNFEINSYTVTFDTDGGSTETPQIVTYKGHATRPTTNPEKTGYDFINWYKDSNYETIFDFSTEEITDETTIYAKFEIKKFTVTFNTDGGTNVPSQTIDYNGYVTRPTPDPTKQGKVFVNWYEDSSYNTVFDFTNTKITSTKTIYAKFANESITVTFDTDGGSTVIPIVLGDGESINTLPTTTKDDYYFLGWYENLSDANPVSEPYTPSADIELKAKWQKLVCKKATTLTSTECHSQSGRGCRLAGYSDGDTVTFGNVVTSDTYVTGDALDCDVDGTGYTKRFYYMRTLNGNAVLISGLTKYASGDTHETNYKYGPAKDLLPTPTEWSNLPVTFENGTKVGRFPTREDTEEAIGSSNIEANNSLKDLEFIFEDIGKYDTTSSTARSTVWVEEVDEDNRYRYHINTNNVVKITATSSTPIADSKNCVKPVIEVPLYLIEDAYIIRYDATGGTVNPNLVKVKKGDALGTTPTPTKPNLVFGDWYTSPSYTTVVNENTIPHSYAVYYAKWVIDILDSTFEDDTFILSEGDEDDIVITISDAEPVTYSSNDEGIVTVDSSGHITAISNGTTTITVTGTKSGHTRTINITVTPEVTDFTVTFDSQGGSAVADMPVPKNTAIGTFPEDPTKTDHTFGGWFTNTNYSTQVTVDTIIRGNVTFYAKWIPNNAVAEVNNHFFTTIQSAIDDTTETDFTVKILKDVTVSAFIDLNTKNTNKNVVMDLQGHTISVDTKSNTQAIKTATTLEIKNGTVNNPTQNGTIDIGAGGRLILNDNVRIENTKNRAAVYNNGGIVEIGGDAYLTSNAQWASNNKRGTVQNLTGTTSITGGTIINTRSSDSYGVSAPAGTLTIGVKDDIYDIQNLMIQGETGGIYSDVNYSLYDGLIKGKTAAVHNESKINLTEDNSTKVKDNDGTYNRLYYTLPLSSYRVTLDPNEGTVDPTFIDVNAGQQVGTLPTPTRGLYTFDGWWTELSGGTEITSSYEPTGNITIHARWHYTSNNNLVNFNMNNNAIETYSTSIGSWKNEDQTTFQTNMMNNFTTNSCSQCENGMDSNSCSSPSSGKYCDQSIGFETGLSDDLNVFESDETNRTKGNPVTYTTSTNGTIYNMIPGETYYWESSNDSSIYGVVKATGYRRMLNTSVRNLRDLGGLSVDTNGDGTVDGTIKYGKLFRGAQLSTSQSDVTNLQKLGITREIDLRPDSEGKNKGQAYLPKYDIDTPGAVQDVIMHNYLIDYTNHASYYTELRETIKTVMKYVVEDQDSIYFHCTIGTDRTGTLAYFLEGLLGVSEEDRIEDYELSYYFGLINRDRYHDTLKNSQIIPRFASMHNTYDTNQKIYDWFMNEDPNLTQSEKDASAQLLSDFRDAMIE